MYLFSHMWTIFSLLDTDIGDKRLSKTEYLNGKQSMGCVPGIEFIKDVTDEDYEKEFAFLDTDGNGYITFEEFCLYTVKRVIKPEKFLLGKSSEDDDDDEEDEKLVFESAADAVAAMEAREKAEQDALDNMAEVKSGTAGVKRIETLDDEMAGFLRRINQEKSYQSYRARIGDKAVTLPEDLIEVWSSKANMADNSGKGDEVVVA
jgi:Ca2+-binding EF-hand superfamily protein